MYFPLVPCHTHTLIHGTLIIWEVEGDEDARMSEWAEREEWAERGKESFSLRLLRECSDWGNRVKQRQSTPAPSHTLMMHRVSSLLLALVGLLLLILPQGVL